MKHVISYTHSLPCCSSAAHTFFGDLPPVFTKARRAVWYTISLRSNAVSTTSTAEVGYDVCTANTWKTNVCLFALNADVTSPFKDKKLISTKVQYHPVAFHSTKTILEQEKEILCRRCTLYLYFPLSPLNPGIRADASDGHHHSFVKERRKEWSERRRNNREKREEYFHNNPLYCDAFRSSSSATMVVRFSQSPVSQSVRPSIAYLSNHVDAAGVLKGTKLSNFCVNQSTFWSLRMLFRVLSLILISYLKEGWLKFHQQKNPAIVDSEFLEQNGLVPS